MAAKGGRISAAAGRGGQVFNVDIQIEGLGRTSEEFKRIRGSINAQLRDAMQRVGEATVLPAMKAELPPKWGETLFIKRDRGGIFIGSRLRGSMNRALGWFDFGGRRPRDHARRTGPHVIVRALDSHRPEIDREIVTELKHAFRNFEQSWS